MVGDRRIAALGRTGAGGRTVTSGRTGGGGRAVAGGRAGAGGSRTVPAGRVIAGRARGTRLVGPGAGTRPLSDRAKEVLFAVLEPELGGARVLDLFAGSGAAGVEALSRGAVRAVFVDRAAAACASVAANLAATGLGGPGAEIRRREVLAYLAGQAAADGPFDLVFVDPPYEEPGLATATLERLASGAALAPGALVVVRTFWRTTLPGRVGLLRSERERRVGEGVLTFYRFEASTSQEGR